MVDPKTTGRAAVQVCRRGVAQRVVELLRERDPEFRDGFVEVGAVSRNFVEESDAGAPVRNAPPLAVVERLLERSVERKPSPVAVSKVSLAT